MFRRKLEHIVAIDALAFHKPAMQFKEFAIKRDLNKAYCGFYSPEGNEVNIPVATGNWGCGAFGGYNRLKCLLQFIACIANRRNLVYFTFNDFELQLEMEEMFEFLQDNDITIAQLWKYLMSFNPQKNFTRLYHHIHEQFLAERELDGLNTEDFNTSQEILEERTVEGSTVSNEADAAIVQEDIKTPNQECIIDIPPESQKILENPTKKMKIDDSLNEIQNQNENETNESLSTILQPPPNNKLITDYFNKAQK